MIDEGHSISEWGTDDFRRDYSIAPGLLRGRLPAGVPVLLASATLPRDVITDIQATVGLTDMCRRISLSNEKPNIALSVRLLQHPEDSFADLMALIPSDATSPNDIEQTIIYVNGRMTAELIEEFFRNNCPGFPPDFVEFYHRHVHQDEKDRIHEHLSNGQLRIVIATDALGMVCYFTMMLIEKVYLFIWSHHRVCTTLL